ncbi:MAG: peptidoglycan DD-metalloendopeptidase family protein [Patescibacteria group bacterium]|nr:peptidoglycan DD-metalloendopeptidase family protein [Patescibacteria group bacterium]
MLAKIKIKVKKIPQIIIALVLGGLFLYPLNILATELTFNNLDNVEIWQINQDINQKLSEIQELNRQIDVYQKNIVAKQREISNLHSQVNTIDESIAKINLEIKAAELEIETVNLRIENTQLKIQAKEKEIDQQKEILAEIIRGLHREQQKSGLLQILILNDNFSDFLAEMDRLKNIQNDLLKGVEDLDNIRIALNSDKDSLEGEKIELDALKNILDSRIESLDSQKTVKFALMQATQGQESKFQELLRQAKEEQEQANKDIIYLERVAREKLNRQLELEAIDSDGLMWPVTSRRITAYFYDPTYPFRNLFEHPAIDIATPQGTPIKAAESGYVARARDGGAKGYSYIMIVHAGGLSTVYGHVNKIIVSEDQFVTKGSIIGYSGGMPGTNGAGPISTGPHLHLEVRLNGVPVDPLKYLP